MSRSDEDHPNHESLGFGYEGGTVRFEVDLHPHAVAAVTLELVPEPSDGGGAT